MIIKINPCSLSIFISLLRKDLLLFLTKNRLLVLLLLLLTIDATTATTTPTTTAGSSSPSSKDVDQQEQKNSRNNLSFNIDRGSIIKAPLTEGLHHFKNGFIENEPLNILKKIHLELIRTIQILQDRKRQIKYIVTLCDSANKEIQELRSKFENELTKSNFDSLILNKTSLKADSFILLVSHCSILSNVILYYPDILNNLLKKNPEFDKNVKWTIEFITKHDLIDMESFKKLFHLVQQELNIIPKEEHYFNPYKGIHLLPPTDENENKNPKKSQKPKRMKSERGPRLSRGEL